MRCVAERGWPTGPRARARTRHVSAWSLAGVLVLVGASLTMAGCRDDSSDDGAQGSGTEGGTASGTDGSGTAADESGTEGAATGGSEWTSLDERPCPPDSFLTWESFGGPYMLDNCTGCHNSTLPADQRQGAPIEVNFDDIEDIRAQADRIWARAADGNMTMPPQGAPGAEERALLGEWLACGAPTNADLGL